MTMLWEVDEKHHGEALRSGVAKRRSIECWYPTQAKGRLEWGTQRLLVGKI
jgi:hypothetical protein